MGKTNIEWTRGDDGSLGKTWNPVTGCSHVSEGCRNCYAEAITKRFRKDHKPWTAANAKHNVVLHPERLEQPLHWKKPCRIFVDSMGDPFHELNPPGFIRGVIQSALLAVKERGHTFIFLTKRAERMLWYLRAEADTVFQGYLAHERRMQFGVSVENQPTADDRIPKLLQCPVATRIVSYEPALGPVDFEEWLQDGIPTEKQMKSERAMDYIRHGSPRIDQIIIGGESGPNGRPFDLQWARDAISKCKAAGVPVFLKQLGSKPFRYAGQHGHLDLHLTDRKGGNMNEWPEDLKIREFPDGKT